MSESMLKAKKPEEVKPGHCKGLLFGKSGAGKTWFALNFPAPYYIDTEGGASLQHYAAKLKESGGVYMGLEEGSNDLETIIEQIKALATEKHPYKTLIIDSITKPFLAAIAKEQEKLGDRDAFGASKKPAVSKMRRLMNWLDRLNMNVWLVAHETPEWSKNEQIGVKPDVWEKVKYDLHLCLRIQNPERGMRVASVDKSRLLGFPEHDTFILQNGKQDLGYAEFAKRYGQDYLEAESTVVTLASPEQVAEITRLVGVLKIDEGEMDKLLDKAGADEYSDLTEEQASKTIKWLKKKLE